MEVVAKAPVADADNLERKNAETASGFLQGVSLPESTYRDRSPSVLSLLRKTEVCDETLAHSNRILGRHSRRPRLGRFGSSSQRSPPQTVSEEAPLRQLPRVLRLLLRWLPWPFLRLWRPEGLQTASRPPDGHQTSPGASLGPGAGRPPSPKSLPAAGAPPSPHPPLEAPPLSLSAQKSLLPASRSCRRSRDRRRCPRHHQRDHRSIRSPVHQNHH